MWRFGRREGGRNWVARQGVRLRCEMDYSVKGMGLLLRPAFVFALSIQICMTNTSSFRVSRLPQSAFRGLYPLDKLGFTFTKPQQGIPR